MLEVSEDKCFEKRREIVESRECNSDVEIVLFPGNFRTVIYCAIKTAPEKKSERYSLPLK